MSRFKVKFTAIFAVLFTIFTLICFMPPKAVAAVSVPKLTMITQPAKEYKPTDRISFTVTSPNYGGRVQYRVILWNGTTKTTSELWKTSSTGYYYTGWMPSGNYNFTINWPAAGMESGAYSLTVLVRRVGSTVPYDSYVKTDAFWIKSDGSTTEENTSEQNTGSTGTNLAVPQLKIVTPPAVEYKAGDRISFAVASPNYKGQVQYRVILYNGTTKTTSELWKTSSTGYYYTGWMPSGNYNFTINWPVTGMEPGVYSLTVLVRRVGSKVPYDSYVKTNAFWVQNSKFPLIIGTSAPVSDYGTAMVKDGDWIYYYDYQENGLTKIKYDGTGKKELSSGIVDRLVIDGDWLYFIISEDVGVNKIRRARKDGTENTQLFKNDFPNEIFSNIAVANGKLYFIYNSTLFSSNLDGTNKQMMYLLGSIRSFMVYNNQIYYTTYSADGHIYKVNFDGTNMTRLTNVNSYNYTVEGDWIYYVNASDGDKLYRSSIGGETYELSYQEQDYVDTLGVKNQIVEVLSPDSAVTPVVKDGWIYYINKDDNYYIYKVRVDGSERTKLTSNMGGINNIIGDWLFYSYNKVTYRIKTNGTELQKMFK